MCGDGEGASAWKTSFDEAEADIARSRSGPKRRQPPAAFPCNLLQSDNTERKDAAFRECAVLWRFSVVFTMRRWSIECVADHAPPAFKRPSEGRMSFPDCALYRKHEPAGCTSTLQLIACSRRACPGTLCASAGTPNADSLIPLQRTSVCRTR